LLVLLAALSLPSFAQGGPPFIGDDPGTPGDGNFEINVAAYVERHPSERLYNAPILDANYGWGPRIQLKYQAPYLVNGTDGGPTRSGLGKSLAGVKWRFYDSGEDGLQISTYPQLEFNNPTSSLQRGLVDYGTRFYLPIELTKKGGPFAVNPEVGYWFASSKGAAWATGVVVARQVSKRLELDANCMTPPILTVPITGTPMMAEAATNWESTSCCCSWQAAIRGPSSGQPQFFGYLGMQFLFSVKHKKKSPPETSP
jgi:hypothetical protein